MTAAAVILARAGSKGLPGKNMLPVAGKPCAAWTIEHAQRSRRVSRVIVSTDDPALKDLAQSMGAHVVDRPADLAGDSATVDAAARHAVREEDSLVRADAPIAILYANVPVRPDDLTDRAIDLFSGGTGGLPTRADSVQSFAPVGKHHPWWTVRVDEASGALAPWQDPEHGLFHGCFRRQDLPRAFVPDGGVMVVSRPALMLEIPGVAAGPHAFLGRPERRRGVVSPEGSVVDIDSKIDLLVADAVLRERRATDRGSARSVQEQHP